jgi:hypothetical protein
MRVTGCTRVTETSVSDRITVRGCRESADVGATVLREAGDDVAVEA